MLGLTMGSAFADAFALDPLDLESRRGDGRFRAGA